MKQIPISQQQTHGKIVERKARTRTGTQEAKQDAQEEQGRSGDRQEMEEADEKWHSY